MGHDFPAPRAALEFLYQFHEEQKIEEAKRRRGPDDIAYIPEESVELQGLGRVNRSLMQELGSRCAGQRIATVDQDATIIESRKQEALRSYEGERGYQPMPGRRGDWAEMDVVLADQFRDGNVPAMMEPAAAGGEGGVRSAAWEGENVLLPRVFSLPRKRAGELARGRKAGVRSPGIHPALRDHRADERGAPRGDPGSAGGSLEAVGGAARGGDSGMRRGAVCTGGEVGTQTDRTFVPPGGMGIRIRKRQGGLFEGGPASRHFALVSNIWDWKAGRLMEWHGEKAGTIEAVHHVVKNDLAGGVLTVSGR